MSFFSSFQERISTILNRAQFNLSCENASLEALLWVFVGMAVVVGGCSSETENRPTSNPGSAHVEVPSDSKVTSETQSYGEGEYEELLSGEKRAEQYFQRALKYLDAKEYNKALDQILRAQGIFHKETYRNLQARIWEESATNYLLQAQEEFRQTYGPLEAEEDGKRQAGDLLTKKADGIEFRFRWCPPGTFVMGGNSFRRNNARPEHTVTLTRGFWMLETEVTQEMWSSVMKESIYTKAPQGSQGWDVHGMGPKYPMYYVSWFDCQHFCSRLREKGLKVMLPTEAQWEYACRAGTEGDYAGELEKMAWYGEDFARRQQEFLLNPDNLGNPNIPNVTSPAAPMGNTHEVGSKQPNAWGLYDMHGNVWEWCADWYGSYCASPVTDPTGPKSGSCRVHRGGGWGDGELICTSARRYGNPPIASYHDLGFRLVLVNSTASNRVWLWRQPEKEDSSHED